MVLHDSQVGKLVQTSGVSADERWGKHFNGQKIVLSVAVNPAKTSIGYRLPIFRRTQHDSGLGNVNHSKDGGTSDEGQY